MFVVIVYCTNFQYFQVSHLPFHPLRLGGCRGGAREMQAKIKIQF
jgi:hypothetical protein